MKTSAPLPTTAVPANNTTPASTPRYAKCIIGALVILGIVFFAFAAFQSSSSSSLVHHERPYKYHRPHHHHHDEDHHHHEKEDVAVAAFSKSASSSSSLTSFDTASISESRSEALSAAKGGHVPEVVLGVKRSEVMHRRHHARRSPHTHTHQQQEGRMLTAGLFDDNVNLNVSKRFFNKSRSAGLPGISSFFDPSGRITVTVLDEQNKPLRGARVALVTKKFSAASHQKQQQQQQQQQHGQSSSSLSIFASLFGHRYKKKEGESNNNQNKEMHDDNNNDGVVGSGVTNANGIVYFFPNWKMKKDQQQQQEDEKFNLIINYKSVSVHTEKSLIVAGKSIEVKLEGAASPSSKNARRLQTAFLVDSTGSMADEMKYIGAELASLSRAFSQIYNNNDDENNKRDFQQESALVFYKDRGDVYVTKKSSDFTQDVEKLSSALSTEPASGGGDFPEAVPQAFQEALSLSWDDKSEETVRILFWVTDAPHHDYDWQKVDKQIREFARRGIRVFPILCSNRGQGIHVQQLEFVMRQIAIVSQAKHIFLTDDSGIGGGHSKPEIHSCYFVTTLMNAMRRVVAMELTGEIIRPSAAEVIRSVGLDTGAAASSPSSTAASSEDDGVQKKYVSKHKTNAPLQHQCTTRDGDTFVAF